MSKESIRSKGESPHTRIYNIDAIGGNTDSGNLNNEISSHNGSDIRKKSHEYTGKYGPGKGK